MQESKDEFVEINENIYEAIKANFDSKIIIKLAKRDSALLNKKYDSEGYTSLILAIINHYPIDVIEELINNGADVDLKDNSGNTPLIMAIQSYSDSKSDYILEVVKFLLKKGADPNKKNNSLNSPLYYAVNKNNYNKSVIDFLIKSGADINSQNNGGISILHNFVFNGLEGALESFLNQDGLNLNIQDISNRTVLSHVLEKVLNIKNDEKKWPELLQILGNHKAKLSDNTYDNKLLVSTIKENNTSKINIFIKLGININAVDSESGLTAFQLAKKLGKEEIAKLLIEAGAKEKEN